MSRRGVIAVVAFWGIVAGLVWACNQGLVESIFIAFLAAVALVLLAAVSGFVYALFK